MCLVALAAISVVSRLPQLQSPNLLVDGDECVLGLMAKHVAQGKEFPVFFYGQHYALETVEAGAGALGFVLFGVGGLTLKLAMLALWTVGVLFWFLALSRIVGITRSFWISAVLILNPVWAAWSMKAGGGYITSFTATALLLWLLVRSREKETIARWLAAGLLTGVIYLAQPLWLPGVLPILLVMLASRRRVWWGVGYLAVAALAILARQAHDRDGNRGMGRSRSGQSRSVRVGVARRAASLRVSDRCVLPLMGDRSARTSDERFWPLSGAASFRQRQQFNCIG